MNWFNYRPYERTRKGRVLPQGVLSINPETGAFKVGNNADTWNELPELGVGSGASGVVGPCTIDRTTSSGAALAAGVTIAMLVPGLLRDIRWEVLTGFDGTTPLLTYLGTAELNFLIAAQGTVPDPLTSDYRVIDNQLSLANANVAVGDWLVPDGNFIQSIRMLDQANSYPEYWANGIIIPDTADLDLIVKIDQGDGEDGSVPGTADDSAVGVVRFYIDQAALTAP